MIKRTVEISTPGIHAGVENGQLVLSRSREVVGRVPLEDIGLLMIDQQQTTMTQAALVGAVENGAAVVLCGADHHPCGLLLPLAGNQLHTERLRLQVETKKTLCKRLWQQIVRRKLKRQADNLPGDHAASIRLRQLAKEVRAGDPDNREAQGARAYWPALFGPEFRRGREGRPPNNLLNYGYMVLRAATARAVVTAGLHPALGLHHHHRNNAFALADDLLEPYRPFVDTRVLALWREGRSRISKESKHRLLAVLTDPVVLGDRSGPLLVALGRTASSLVECLAGRSEQLDLPEP